MLTVDGKSLKKKNPFSGSLDTEKTFPTICQLQRISSPVVDNENCKGQGKGLKHVTLPHICSFKVTFAVCSTELQLVPLPVLLHRWSEKEGD